ncbi:hypothetical protein [Bradyrhizobium zhanjiangense]|uniref:Uncharacterized protein n=1 Tax=Bradyrhizobium zhanjiangense TaxID=1325107 RepID=A0ABY0DHM1_9BRAD|nr:hypothetical protein [Bradyrhizobium zhanjiangense]RXG92596.1 hypothetical protein EAS62_21590 [Bradyrhizobium zhanjiangense]
MFRFAASVLVLLFFLAPAAAQTPPATATPSAQTAPQAKPAAKKATAKPKAPAKPTEQTTAGPCGVGVIAATQDPFVVEKIGLTVFGNEYAEVPVSWGLDDLVFARVRAAAGATPLRRIAYAKGAFDAYYHPKPSLFRNEREELSNLIRQIAGNAGCERYVVVTRGEGMLPGTNQPLRGLGILNRGAGIISYSFLYAYIGVTVFDGQTFEIKKGPGVTLEGVMKHMADSFVQDERLRKIDNSLFPVTAADSAGNTTLRDNMRDFLTERLDKILPPYFAQ